MDQKQYKETDFLNAAYNKIQRVKPTLIKLLKQSELNRKALRKMATDKDAFPQLEDRQRIEAVLRMAELQINREVIDHFTRRGVPLMFLSPYDLVCSLDCEAYEEVEQLENQYGAVVYAVIRTDTTVGRLDSLLYVCKTPSE